MLQLLIQTALQPIEALGPAHPLREPNTTPAAVDIEPATEATWRMDAEPHTHTNQLAANYSRKRDGWRTHRHTPLRAATILYSQGLRPMMAEGTLDIATPTHKWRRVLRRPKQPD